MSTELIQKVDGILKNDLPERHTFFQIEKFLIGKEPTGQAQLWQIVRELRSRHETVESYKKQLEDCEDELELFDIRIERLDRTIRDLAKIEVNEEWKGEYPDLRIKECEVNIRKLQREKDQLVKSAQKVNQKLKCVMEEMSFLAHGYDRIKAVVGDMKSLDDEQAQREYWNEKLLEEFNLRVMFNRPLDPEFVKTVLSLEDGSPVKNHVIGLVNQIQNKMIEQGKKELLENKKAEKPTAKIKGDLSLFPEALDDQDSLYEAKNNAETTLRQTVTYNSKIIVVEDASGFPDKGQIRIGPPPGVPGSAELVYYDKKTSNTFQDLKRGFAGSRRNYWPARTTFVTSAVKADHHNSVKDALINMEVDLGVEEFPTDESLNGILKFQEVRFLAPKPLFRASQIKGPPPHKVTFQNFTTGHIARYLWDFGDGGTSLEKSPQHTYLTEGNYSVKLNVITSTGAQGIATKVDYIVVDANEASPFFYVDDASDPYSVATATEMMVDPKEFRFVDQTDGEIVQRNWLFGDGESYTEEDPDVHEIGHIYQEPGEYTVTLLDIFANGRLKYPAEFDGDDNLFEVHDAIRWVLAEDYNPGDTSISVVPDPDIAAIMPDTGLITLTEQCSDIDKRALSFHYDTFDAENYTISGLELLSEFTDKDIIKPKNITNVTMNVMQRHHNHLKDALIAIQEFCGVEGTIDSEPFGDTLEGRINFLRNIVLVPRAWFTSDIRTGIVPLEVEFNNLSFRLGTDGNAGDIIVTWDFGDQTVSQISVSNLSTISATSQVPDSAIDVLVRDEDSGKIKKVYHTPGIYSVKLTVENDFGKDECVFEDWINARVKAPNEAIVEYIEQAGTQEVTQGIPPNGPFDQVPKIRSPINTLIRMELRSGENPNTPGFSYAGEPLNESGQPIDPITEYTWALGDDLQHPNSPVTTASYGIGGIYDMKLRVDTEFGAYRITTYEDSIDVIENENLWMWIYNDATTVRSYEYGLISETFKLNSNVALTVGADASFLDNVPDSDRQKSEFYRNTGFTNRGSTASGRGGVNMLYWASGRGEADPISSETIEVREYNGFSDTYVTRDPLTRPWNWVNLNSTNSQAFFAFGTQSGTILPNTSPTNETLTTHNLVDLTELVTLFTADTYLNGAIELAENPAVYEPDGTPTYGHYSVYRSAWSGTTGYFARNDGVGPFFRIRNFYRTEGTVGDPFVNIRKMPDILGPTRQEGQLTNLSGGIYLFNNSGSISQFLPTDSIWRTGGPGINSSLFRSIQDTNVVGFDEQTNTLLVASDSDKRAYISFDYSNDAFIKFNEIDTTFVKLSVRPEDYTLFLVYNTTETKLSADNSPWAQEISIIPVGSEDPEIWADNGFANISGELLYYDSVEYNANGKVNKLKGCARSLGGDKTQFNAKGTWIRSYVIAEHHNQMVNGVLRTQDFIGFNFDPRQKTLDWRIRNLQELAVIFDDFACPDINFIFNEVENDPETGILTQYLIQLNPPGTLNDFRLDFGDGEFTTTILEGEHRYAVNATIDPVLTVTNDKCQMIITPVERANPQEPPPAIEDTFEIPIPEVPDFTDFTFVPCEVPEPDINLPPLVFPCISIEGQVGPIPSVIEGPDFPSIITINSPNDINITQSVVNIIVEDDIPDVIIIDPPVPPTIIIDPPIPPTIIIVPPDSNITLELDATELPKLEVDWGQQPEMEFKMQMVKEVKTPQRFAVDERIVEGFGTEFADLFEAADQYKVEYEAVDFPSEIQIVAPELPKIEIDSGGIPKQIKLDASEVDIPTDVFIHGPESPIPNSIKFDVTDLPETIGIVAEGVSIPVDTKGASIELTGVEEIPEEILVRMVDPIPTEIMVNAEGIPTELKVTGFPEGVVLEIPEDAGIPVLFPEEMPQIEIAPYSGAPLELKITMDELNHITSPEDRKLLTENEKINDKLSLANISDEEVELQKVVIISDGYNFEERHKLIKNFPSDVSVIAVNGALKKWSMSDRSDTENFRTVNVYLVNNPYTECLRYLPHKSSTYYPTCVASSRTSPEFLKQYRGNMYLYTPSPESSFGYDPPRKYRIDDYRNPICAAVGLAYRFKAEKIMLMCCDDAFEDQRAGALELENQLWVYPQQKLAEKVIDANLYWLKNSGDVEISSYSDGADYTNAAYITTDEEAIQFFKEEPNEEAVST
ncbi:colH [Symbiodinium microadriaticum]|nr:colH [Symbiodinium microadriaticum]